MKRLKKILSSITSHPLTRKNKISAISRFLSFQLFHFLLPDIKAYRLVENSKIYARKRMTGATGNIYTGLAEFNEMAFVLHLLRKGDLFGDIGANVGVYSILASVNAGADSIAIEPIPETFNTLLKNIELNDTKKITPILCGVGDKKGELRFNNMFDTYNGVCVNQEQTENTTLVKVDTLDDIFITTPHLLKIDVEGYEYNALNGAKRILSDSKLKAIIIETVINNEVYGGGNVHELLTSYGFVPFQYEPFARRLTNNTNSNNAIYIRDTEWVRKRVENSRKYRVLRNSI